MADDAEQRAVLDHLDRPVGGQHRADGLPDHHVGAELGAVQPARRPSGGRMTQRRVSTSARGHLADEVADVVVGGRADQLVAGADLHQLAVAHDQDPVAEPERLGQVVGDEDHRLADLVVQPDHLVLHVPADQRVERRERLVEEQHVGVAGEGPGQPDPLLHAAGELVRVGVLVAGEPDQVEHLLGPAQPVGPAGAADLEAVRDVVDHPAVRQQAEVLEDHGEPVAAQLAQRVGRRRQRGPRRRRAPARRSARPAGSGSGPGWTCPSRTAP